LTKFSSSEDSQNSTLLYVRVVAQATTSTSAERVFGRDYFFYFAPVLEPGHIRPRPKRVSFWPQVLPEAENSFHASVLLRTEA